MKKRGFRQSMSLLMAAAVLFSATLGGSAATAFAADSVAMSPSDPESIGASDVTYSVRIRAEQDGEELDVGSVLTAGDVVNLEAELSTTGASPEQVSYSWSSARGATFSDENSRVTDVTLANDANGQIAESLTVTVTGDNSGAELTSATFRLKVDAEEILVERIEITPKNEQSLNVGGALSFSCAFSPDGTETGLEWTSTDDAVASIDSSGKLNALATGSTQVYATTTTLGASGDLVKSNEVTVLVTDDITYATDVTLGATSLEVIAGKTRPLSAAITPGNTTVRGTWTSQDPAVAKVSNPARAARAALDQTTTVEGVAVGQTEITFRIQSDATDYIEKTLEVNVIRDPDEVDLTGVTIGCSGETSLQAGDTTVLNALPAPSGATHVTYRWEAVAGSAAVSIAGADTKRAVVTANAVPGDTAVTLRLTASQNGRSYTAEQEITVRAASVSSVSITEPAGPISLNPQQTQRFAAQVLPASASQTVTWASSDTAVASIDANGLLTAVAEGTADITAVSGSVVSAPVRVTVTNVVVYAADAVITPNAVALAPGKTQAMSVSIQPAGVTVRGVWSIDKTDVATVDASGVVKALKPGEATLTYKIASGATAFITKTVKVTVVSRPVTGITLNQSSGLMFPGDTLTLTAAATPADATDGSVVWTSSEPRVATVKDGVVTAVGAGAATITAASKTNPDVQAQAQITVKLKMTGQLKMLDGSAGRYKRLEIRPETGSIFSISTEYEGTFEKELGVGSYTIESLPYTSGNGRLNVTKVINTGDTAAQWDLQYPEAQDGTLTVQVRDAYGRPVAGARVSMYIYIPNYFNVTGYTNANGDYKVSTIPLDPVQSSEIYVNCWTDDGAHRSTIAVLSASEISKTVALTVPAVTTISGRIVSGGRGVTDVYVNASNGSRTYGAYTGADGAFSIRSSSMPSGTYTVKASSGSKYITLQPARVTVSASSLAYSAGDIEVTTGVSLSGRVLFDGRTDNYTKAYVHVYGPGGHIASGYASAATGFGFDSVIKQTGEYWMNVSYMYDLRGSYVYGFNSQTVRFNVTDLPSDKIIRDIMVESRQNTTSIFSGDGNSLTTDKQIVKDNDKFSVIGKYKNNGTQPVTATFKTTLAGARVDDNFASTEWGKTSHTVKLQPGESGRFDIKCLTGDEKEVSVKTTVTINGMEYGFGMVGLEMIDITLNAASTSVKAGTPFKIYGEANEQGVVSLLDSTGKVLSVIPLSPEAGRWYSAQIKFDQPGEYKVYAQVEKGSEIAVSDSITFHVSNDPVEIKNVRVDQLRYEDLPFNSRIGMRTFSHSVYSDLTPWPLTLRTTFSSDRITSVTYHFAGKDFTASLDNQGRWASSLAGWRGTGILRLTATVKTADGQTIEFTVAEVTVLVDPSGYITDADTGSPIPGARVECFYKVPGTKDDWAHWDSEPHGQPANPWVTGENGYYGWDVPTGVYKVFAEKPGYESLSSDAIQKYAGGINIPPPALDVDLKLTPTTKMEVDGISSEDGDIVLTFSRYVKSAGITVYKDGQAVEITSKVDGNRVVVSSSAFKNNTEYQVEVRDVTPKNEGKKRDPLYFLDSYSGSVRVTGVSSGPVVRPDPSQPESSPSKTSDSSDTDYNGNTWDGSSRSIFSSVKISPDDVRNAPRIGGNAVLSITGANPRTTDKALIKALNALENGEKLTLRQIVDRMVAYQFTIDPATLTSLPPSLNFGLTTVNRPVQSLFEKYFKNKIVTITLRHQGDFGFTARLAVKVNLSGMDPNSINAYYYNVKANTYQLIPDANLIVDANGYVHLSVTKGGPIVLSDGPLTK